MRSLTDAPVTVTGVEVDREGDGVSYISLGFPGATVQLLQKLADDNLADDLERIAPDVIVLAFGTNEGFNDALDVARLFRAIRADRAKRLKSLRPQARIVIIGPPDGARAAGACKPGGPAARRPRERRRASACRLPTPPKLAQVREAQRRLADAARSRFLGLVVGDAEPMRRASVGRRRPAADGPRLRAYDDGRL